MRDAHGFVDLWFGKCPLQPEINRSDAVVVLKLIEHHMLFS